MKKIPLAPLGAALLIALPWPGTAQTPPSLNGPFAFVASANQLDSAGANGGAVIGILNFDGAGSINGTYTVKTRTGKPTPADTASGMLSGTYMLNADGTGVANVNFDAGFDAKLSLVITDAGQGIQFADISGGANTNMAFQGEGPKSLSGSLPMSYFIPGAKGGIPISLSGSSTDAGMVYTSAASNGNGTMMCPDGTPGPWTASLAPVAAFVTGSGPTSGNFLMGIFFNACGSPDFETISGLATGIPTPNGYNLVLHAFGFVIQGSGRATGSASAGPSGSYGFQFNGSPFPTASVGVMSFDGAGKVTAAFNNGGVENIFSGTYSTNPDGSGTINLKGVTNPAASSAWAFATADNGSTLFFLRTDGGANGASTVTGTARLQ